MPTDPQMSPPAARRAVRQTLQPQQLPAPVAAMALAAALLVSWRGSSRRGSRPTRRMRCHTTLLRQQQWSSGTAWCSMTGGLLPLACQSLPACLPACQSSPACLLPAACLRIGGRSRCRAAVATIPRCAVPAGPAESLPCYLLHVGRAPSGPQCWMTRATSSPSTAMPGFRVCVGGHIVRVVCCLWARRGGLPSTATSSSQVGEQSFCVDGSSAWVVLGLSM